MNADKNSLAYWSGLVLLFAGLAIGVSIATALIVIGAVLISVSMASSFYLTALVTRPKRGK